MKIILQKFDLLRNSTHKIRNERSKNDKQLVKIEGISRKSFNVSLIYHCEMALKMKKKNIL